jgi:hypothetical protein
MSHTKAAFRRSTLAVILLMLVASVSEAQAKLPGGVSSRLKKIDTYLAATESRLQTGSTDRNDLDRARDALEEIKKGYPDFTSHPDVVEAGKKIARVEKLMADSEAGKKQKKTQAAEGAAADEKVLGEWAERLSAYKADSTPGSRGHYGAPSGDIEALLADRKFYEEAKSLYAEFLKTGLDKDAHFKLRQAEYDIKVAILNYEKSLERIPEEADRQLDAAIKWMGERTGDAKNANLSTHQLETIVLLLESSARLFPGSEKVRALNVKKADLDKRMEEADQSILENRTMRADQYKGKDAAELKKMAQAVVLKDVKGATILKVNTTSASWESESVLEWSDTTHSALQHRVTDSVYALVAARQGSDIFLYTVYLNKDRVDGRQLPLTGHVMYKDRLLEKNIR